MTFALVGWIAGGIFVWLVIIMFVLMMWHGTYRARANHEPTREEQYQHDDSGV